MQNHSHERQPIKGPKESIVHLTLISHTRNFEETNKIEDTQLSPNYHCNHKFEEINNIPSQVQITFFLISANPYQCVQHSHLEEATHMFAGTMVPIEREEENLFSVNIILKKPCHYNISKE